MKKILSFVMLLTFAVLLISCGQSASTTTAATTYYISFEGYDGNVINKIQEDAGTDLSSVETPTLPNDPSYIFEGWNYSGYENMPKANLTVTPSYIYNSSSEIADKPGYISNAISGDYYTIGIASEQKVLVYKYSDNSYIREIGPDSDEQFKDFGNKVACSGDYLVVSTGSYSDDQTNYSLYIFKLSDDSYERKISNVTVPFDSIKIQDDYLALSDITQHSITIYSLNDDTYSRTISRDNDNVDFDVRGFTLSGDYIISANTDENVQKVFVHKLSDPTYSRIITSPDGSDNQQFGWPISTQENYLIVSDARYGANQLNPDCTGIMYIFKLDDENYIRTIKPEDSDHVLSFGYTVDISGDYFIVNTSKKPNIESYIYIYKFDDENYLEKINTDQIQSDADYYFYDLNITVNGDYLICDEKGYYASGGIKYFDYLIKYKFDDPNYKDVLNVYNEATGETDTKINDFYCFKDYLVYDSTTANNNQGILKIYKYDDDNYNQIILGNQADIIAQNNACIETDNGYLLYLTHTADDVFTGHLNIYDLEAENSIAEIKLEGEMFITMHGQNDFINGITIASDYQKMEFDVYDLSHMR